MLLFIESLLQIVVFFQDAGFKRLQFACNCDFPLYFRYKKFIWQEIIVVSVLFAQVGVSHAHRPFAERRVDLPLLGETGRGNMPEKNS